MKNGWKLLISILIPLGIGFLGSYFTRPEIDTWYQTIQKPSWQPPSWIFGPVWTTLYIMMGIAFFLVWKNQSGNHNKKPAMIFWCLQLVLNFFWSYIFFNRHELGLALAEIILLWIFILITIILFGRVSKVAAWLMVPYISWVSFAAMLTYTIYSLNN
ncbi:MAG: TspO/MBR family protein [Flavisolibacter sp.]